MIRNKMGLMSPCMQIYFNKMKKEEKIEKYVTKDEEIYFNKTESCKAA